MNLWRGVQPRRIEGARLESVYTGNRIKGSNLFLSANSSLSNSLHREVSEWLKEHAWKVCIRETVSRVRIPSSLQI